MNDKPRILIEGIGAIGGVMAGRLIQAGYAPALVTANSQITEAINRDGLKIIAEGKTTTVPAKTYTTLSDIPPGERFDAAYLLIKAHTVVEAAGATLPSLTPDGYVVTFQNGIVEDAVSAAIGTARVIGGIVAWGGTMRAPGVYEKTTPGETHIGELNGQITPRLQHLVAVITPVAPVEVTRNIRGALWSKLAINCTITTLGALTGDTLGVMLRDRRIRQIFGRIYSEVIDTAEASGITLERVGANPRTLYVSAQANALNRALKDLIVRFLGRRYGKMKSSMLQSLERGRKTEIDFLNGYVVEQAKKVNVPTPVNAALVRLIKEIEAGQRPIDRKNVADLLTEVG